jgi:transglutaminase-like putative cysteine protease
MQRSAFVVVPLLLLLAGAGPAAGAFPPITAAQKALREVPGQPGVAGVILANEAELYFRDYPKDANSRIEVRGRIKVLTEEGKALGELEIAHNRRLRLDKLEARITLADGRALEVPKEAFFRERRSRSRKSFVTKVAFPQVEVGAILDWSYTLYWDSFYYLEPFFFHDELPVLSSTVTYHVPPSLGVQVWGRETSSQKLQVGNEKGRFGVRIKASMENLPALPDEPYSYPREILSSRFMAIPTRLRVSGGSYPLLESWKEVVGSFLDTYKDFQSGGRAVKKEASARAAAAGIDPETQARALFEFVRDEVRSLDGEALWPSADAVDKVLAKMEAGPCDKALLLHSLLLAAEVPARLVWVANRREGRVEREVPNPAAFDAILVEVELGGRRLYLDPGDRSLAFGALAPFYEGTAAVVLERKEPEHIVLPTAPVESNVQHAELQLTVDAEGKVGGTGSLRHQGHYGWRWLRWHEKPEDTVKAWQDNLRELLPGFDVLDVQVAEDLRLGETTVRFRLDQRPESVLGDEVTLQPSRPYPTVQAFALPPERRLTPVVMAFAGVDSVKLDLRWPQGWSLDALPKPAQADDPTGSFSYQVRHEAADRHLVVERRLLRARHEVTVDAYGGLRRLYEQAAAADAQTVVLVRD